MYYTIYKVTNRLNGKIYIGSHKTGDLNDGYMGSGTYLKRAIEKHGVENFTKEVLFVFDNPEAMYAKEAELVNEDYLMNENTYNMKVGGFGGFDYLNTSGSQHKKLDNWLGKHLPESTKKAISKALKGKKRSEEVRRKLKPPSFKGKCHNEDTRKLIAQKAKIANMGNKNPNFDKEWITNGVENRMIKRGLTYPKGFYKGRFLFPSSN